MTEQEPVRGERKILEQLKVACQTVVAREVAERALPAYVGSTATLDARVLDHDATRLVVRLRAYVLTDHLVHDRYHSAPVRYPVTWWQHWKWDHRHAWYARRLVARWPVRWSEHELRVDFDRWATYPDATISPPPSLGAPVMYEQVSPLGWYPAAPFDG